MRCDRLRAARKHQFRSAARHRLTCRELPVVQHPRIRSSFTPLRLHGASTEDAYRFTCRVLNGSFAPNIAVQAYVPASPERSFMVQG